LWWFALAQEELKFWEKYVKEGYVAGPQFSLAGVSLPIMDKCMDHLKILPVEFMLLLVARSVHCNDLTFTNQDTMVIWERGGLSPYPDLHHKVYDCGHHSGSGTLLSSNTISESVHTVQRRLGQCSNDDECGKLNMSLSHCSADAAAGPTVLQLKRFGATLEAYPNLAKYAQSLEVGVPEF
jgi:hypothetical protein